MTEGINLVPEGLAEMIAKDSRVFTTDVAIEAAPGEDVAEIQATLEASGFSCTVRRVGERGMIHLVSYGLRYDGPEAVSVFLGDNS